MANFPIEMQVSVAPLPESVDQSKLNKHGLTVVQGLDMERAQQLVEASSQAHIVESCPDDTTRFGNIESITNWLAQGRFVLPLIEQVGDERKLAGIGWMGQENPGEEQRGKMPGATTRFALRLYEGARGRRLSLPYVQTMLQAHAELYGNNDSIWLSVRNDNPHAIRTYAGAHFRYAAEELIPQSKITRIFMTLGELAVG